MVPVIDLVNRDQVVRRLIKKSNVSVLRLFYNSLFESRVFSASLRIQDSGDLVGMLCTGGGVSFHHGMASKEASEHALCSQVLVILHLSYWELLEKRTTRHEFLKHKCF